MTQLYRVAVLGTGRPGDHYRLDLPESMPPGTRFVAAPWINADGTMVAAEIEVRVTTDAAGHETMAAHVAARST